MWVYCTGYPAKKSVAQKPRKSVDKISIPLKKPFFLRLESAINPGNATKTKRSRDQSEFTNGIPTTRAVNSE